MLIAQKYYEMNNTDRAQVLILKKDNCNLHFVYHKYKIHDIIYINIQNCMKMEKCLGENKYKDLVLLEIEQSFKH